LDYNIEKFEKSVRYPNYIRTYLKHFLVLSKKYLRNLESISKYEIIFFVLGDKSLPLMFL